MMLLLLLNDFSLWTTAHRPGKANQGQTQRFTKICGVINATHLHIFAALSSSLAFTIKTAKPQPLVLLCYE